MITEIKVEIVGGKKKRIIRMNNSNHRVSMSKITMKYRVKVVVCTQKEVLMVVMAKDQNKNKFSTKEILSIIRRRI